jgi:hypothetical protein
LYPEWFDQKNQAEDKNESNNHGVTQNFSSEKDLATYIMKTVFGRKKVFAEGTSI